MMRADLVVIGAGPAGMAAARIAAEGGLQVMLLDEQDRAGGQIYRNVAAAAGRDWLGADYARGADLVRSLDHPGIEHESRATVWRIDQDRGVIWSRDGESHISAAAHVLIATGAQERPVPFPGWTLPGAMPAGAAQILMKQSGMLPRDAILAGSGPLLYLVAAQMIAAGSPPIALVETGTGLLRASPKLLRALPGARTLAKGLGLIRRIRAAGIPRYHGATGFLAEQVEDGRVAFSFTTRKGRQHLACGLLLTHLGVIPQTHLTRSMGLAHDYDDAQQAWRPRLDGWGQSSMEHVFVAGDGGGIGGADAARAQGALAALAILHRAGRLDAEERDDRARPLRRALSRSLSVRPLLDAAYSVPPAFLAPPDDTIICRCEEVTARAVRETVADGTHGLRLMRTALRTGMGPCQGRMCEATVTGLIAHATGRHPSTIGPGRIRTPVKPVTLAEIASLGLQPEETA
ncbi:NADPH-dependent 2,4-dienoyl-CoA reductase, sulfur reductase [Paracoccus aminovorans]|uniref:NADPH-dependent 2,4-dienoyl-CoA reductase, sulfur reductase n=1 Tax=Paracoccus aminovorans TaxID=34004 RepID=A0A1I3AMU5_9RHOB|nr:NAD(P)/FAD-dependent oxidoreductase [Paracoccus aminovorans]CQR84275.1 Opine oxidase subunit A [Paracoccus aminovorans]SFH51335.1 NADPH-dependent 2,4-dienoyl-CoA reductase, sulfur reductase [Paracoccus aminovorans]